MHHRYTPQHLRAVAITNTVLVRVTFLTGIQGAQMTRYVPASRLMVGSCPMERKICSKLNEMEIRTMAKRPKMTMPVRANIREYIICYAVFHRG